MPFQVNSGIRGDPFAYCQRCGLKYRLSAMTTQNGLLLCRRRCIDDTRRMLRNDRIAMILQDGKIEAEDLQAVKKQEPNIVREI